MGHFYGALFPRTILDHIIGEVFWAAFLNTFGSQIECAMDVPLRRPWILDSWNFGILDFWNLRRTSSSTKAGDGRTPEEPTHAPELLGFWIPGT